MAEEFMVRPRFTDAEFKRMGRARMLVRTSLFMSKDALARARLRERPDGKFVPRSEAYDKVRRLTRRPVGTKVIVSRPDGGELVIVKVEKSVPKPPNLGCAPALEVIHAIIWEKYPRARSAGRFLCRFVDGTRVVSAHGYFKRDPNGWLGRAEDVFFSSFGQQSEAANYMVGQHKAGNCEVARIISHDMSWTPAGGWVSYSGIYHYHLHIEVAGGEACDP